MMAWYENLFPGGAQRQSWGKTLAATFHRPPIATGSTLMLVVCDGDARAHAVAAESGVLHPHRVVLLFPAFVDALPGGKFARRAHFGSISGLAVERNQRAWKEGGGVLMPKFFLAM